MMLKIDFVATIPDDLRQLRYRERLLAKNEIKKYTIYATQGNFKNQNFNNRNSFVSLLGYQLPLPFNSLHGNSFPIQQPHNQNYNSFQSSENTHYASPAQSPSYPP